MNDPKQSRIDGSWRPLLKIGAVAPLITILTYLIEVLAIAFAKSYPSSTEEWFLLFQQNKILGMLYLNAFDMFSITILGIMFLALYVVLKQENQSYMAIAVFLTFMGLAMFVSNRSDMFTAIFTLSQRYAEAVTEAQKLQLLSAGEAIGATVRATVETTGFLFIAIAGLIISIVMLKSKRFSRTTAYTGILGGMVTVANHTALVIAPAVAAILMPVSGLLWLLWWLLVSRSLYRLAAN